MSNRIRFRAETSNSNNCRVPMIIVQHYSGKNNHGDESINKETRSIYNNASEDININTCIEAIEYNCSKNKQYN